MPGSKPGERRGGRQLGTRNKANVEKNEALESALRLAFAKHGSAYIRTLTPAQFQFLAMHEAIEAGFIYSALAIADKVAPYYDARLAPLIVEPPAEPEEAKAKRLHMIASQPDSKGRVHDDLLQTPVSGCEGGHLGGGGAGQRGGAYVQIWRHSYEAYRTQPRRTLNGPRRFRAPFGQLPARQVPGHASCDTPDAPVAALEEVRRR
jgi:hypothetical protein